MHTELNLAATSLQRGQLQRLQDARGSLVLCLSGTLWLTQEGDLQDIVLEAGDGGNRRRRQWRGDSRLPTPCS